MGGCRCTFRDCENSSVTRPNMHFFHFPYKDVTRCKKWALTSNNISFLSMPDSKLRNKVVCEDHFLDKCFMNFKKERLVKTAVPTLYKSRNSELQVFECTDDQAEAIDIRKESEQIDLPTAQQAHSSDSPKLLNKTNIEPIYKNIEFTTLVTRRKICVPSDATSKKNKKMKEEVYDVVDSIIETVDTPADPTYNMHLNVNTVADTSRTLPSPSTRKILRTAIQKTDVETQILPTRFNKTILNNIKIETVKSPPPPRRVLLGKRKNVANIEILDDKVIMPNTDEIDNTETVEFNEPESLQTDIIVKTDSTQLEDMAKQIEELKSLLTEKVTSNNPNGEVASINAAMQSSSSFVKVQKGPAMTKIQLFNGIRKYLNPSMIALLRMEMFGSSDRDYRPDEKEFAKELFNLNKDVYNHMKDEWRFRLPSTSDVQQWVDKQEDEEVWELC